MTDAGRGWVIFSVHILSGYTSRSRETRESTDARHDVSLGGSRVPRCRVGALGRPRNYTLRHPSSAGLRCASVTVNVLRFGNGFVVAGRANRRVKFVPPVRGLSCILCEGDRPCFLNPRCSCTLSEVGKCDVCRPESPSSRTRSSLFSVILRPSTVQTIAIMTTTSARPRDRAAHP